MNKELIKLINKKKLKIDQILREPDGGMVRSYIIKVVDVNNKPYILKYFDSQDDASRKRFIKDVKINRYFKKQFPNKKYVKHLLDIYWSSLRGNNPVCLYEYAPGEVIGNFTEDYGIKWGLFNDSNFKEFINILLSISKLEDIKIDDISIEHFSKYIVDKEIDHYHSNNPGLFSDEKWTEISNYLDNNHKIVFKDYVYSHKDLYPENVILKEKFKKSFKLIDFEHFSLVPIGFDAAFLYLLFWREEYWQGKICSLYYNRYNCHVNRRNKENFEVSFRHCLVVLAVRLIYQSRAYGDSDTVDYHNAVSSYKSLLDKALNGRIIKPENLKFLMGEDELNEIAKYYGIGKVSCYEVFYASKGNTVVRIEISDNEKYIFRLYSPRRTTSMIKNEIRVIKHLKEFGIPTYKIIEMNGSYLNRFKFYNVKQNIVVFSYVKGKKILREYANYTTAVNAGKMLRRIHDAHVVHGDYSKENVLFSKEKITGVIDFEWGRITKSKSAKNTDLARAIMLWLIDVRSKNISDIEFTIAFIEGYIGRKPKNNELIPILERVVSKIEEERETFLSISGFREHHKGLVGNRFDKAIENVYKLMGE